MRPLVSKLSFLLLLTLSFGIAGQSLAQSGLVSLTKNWILEKTNVKGTYFAPEEHEKGDKLTLYPNHHFVRIDGGVRYIGVWKLDCEQERIILKYCGSDKEKTLLIEAIDEERLVLKLEEDWKMDMRIYLRAGVTS
ncbi:hypothetical protein R9C00_17455 [Flammeovirgaceae bacterium SG7u.111]|nr:hypothetical protein [Flammeovirgaceae bacterium SG7u.132]WPO33490.1 hypothetical protein R9C00_17455 [Flammeovirgaceae bacterium SG7u.111]